MAEMLCFAVPGGNSMIDVISPETGLSQVKGETLEQISVRYPGAQIMRIDDWCKSRAVAQDTPVVWIECTEERYYEMLEVLPPAFQSSRGFLVGEAMDHHAVTGRPRFSAFTERTTKGDGWSETRYFEASRPMTVTEFRNMKDE